MNHSSKGLDKRIPKTRAPRNRTITIVDGEKVTLMRNLVKLEASGDVAAITDRLIHQDLMDCVAFLPNKFIDLLIIDPPYNLSKTFGSSKFFKTSSESYEQLFENWFLQLMRCLKPNASIYVCCDWQSSNVIFTVLSRHLIVRNRITWEREKGRGANSNWKNCSEDIWFCTASDEYFFDVGAVKSKRRVIAPYRDAMGNPKDWEETLASTLVV